jgi:uracil permease
MSALVKWQGIGVVKRLFPPVVIGPVIMLIGLSLSSTGVNMASEDWILALVALVTAIIVSMFAKGLLKLIPIFSGIIVGYIVAIIMGKIDFSAIAAAPWFSLPKFVTPQFSWQAILFMAPVAIAPVIEHVGDVYAVSQVAEKDFVKNPGLHRTMLGDGIACSIAGLIGGPPVTTYSEVTGAMVLTKITDPMVIRIAAITGIVFSLVGKISVFLKTIPNAVLGGIMLLLFGMIAATGVNNMIQNKTDMSNTRNLIIASLILTTGIGGAIFKVGDFTFAGIGLAAMVGVILNLILPRQKEEKKEIKS